MNYSANFSPRVSDSEIFESIKKEKQDIGYYNLPFQDTTLIKEYAQTVKQKDIAIIGIGGSTLGTFAIYSFLTRTHNFDKKLYFFESTDPIDINTRLERLDLDNTLFIVISKSGTTIETISVFKYLYSKVKIDKNNCLIITETDSKLNDFAQSNDIKTFEIPKNVGGRFSVFSTVGLVPLAIVGIDIDRLLDGAKEAYSEYFEQEALYKRIMTKARFMAEYKHKFNNNVVFSYASELEGFNKWYVQLWGESLGKIDKDNTHQGLTPIGLLGPVDQHSFLQLIIQGKRDKTVTFIKIKDFADNSKIPDVKLKGLEELDYINNLKFSELINHQADATIEAVHDLQDIPCDTITMDKVDGFSLAKLMYVYELLTSIVGKFLFINAYDQPGVESGKIILKEKLKKKK
ncbi:phosphoglucose isomerase (PGI) [Arcobacter nitrofigilis DSM 7299]|uniref:Glucose-6-phosphate isomerase n=1 Tax=Arcobacter nitrofigilis (strain ATCC 33309 / DSM 7299 / CCUG 15893 / LMG 7604 / NCTC 12251 / CI) TaxID=572480 RepID=D5V4F2_ARCNC|nr:glucose-6-phosphate isomerase [Arcobacter nitrofigilis]ADG91885.1 phosphoglucose isomerase (PGI) [Arcobacter nitrofigilis DSM 7299]